MTKDEALKLALKALTPFSTPNWAGTGVDKANEAITAIKQALAAPVQEPVAIVDEDGVIVVCNYKYKPGDKLYTTPPAAPVPLTQRQVIDGFCKTPNQVQYVAFFDAGVRFAEAAHGITAAAPEKGQP